MNNTRLYISLVFIFLPFIYLASVYGGLPERIPTHFDLFGNPDKWSPKYVLWFYPGIGIPLMLLVNAAILRNVSPENISSKQRNIGLLILGFSSVIICYFIYSAEATTKPDMSGLWILMGLLFIGLGNYFPILPRNGLAGIKVPPTLNSDWKWRKTHRFAGPFYVVGGGVIMLCGIFLRGTLMVGTALAVSFVMNIIPIVYAYRLPDDEEGDLV